MAAPSFVGAGAGVIIQTGGAAVTAAGSGVAVGDLVILQVLQDGTAASAVTYSAISGIANLAGTASSLTTLATDQTCGTLAKQHLRVGRATSTTCTVTATTTGDDLYCRIYVFRNVNTGTALTDVIENSTAGTFVNGSGATAAVADTGVTTLGADRLALNFVAVDDDNPLAAFTGMTGGTWQEAVAEFASATGTDGAIQLQIAEIGASGVAGQSGIWKTLGITAQSHKFGQSYTAPYTGTLASVTFKADVFGAPADDVTVEIQSDASGSPSGTAIGTTATINVTGAIATYVANVNAPITSGTPYWIVFARTGATEASNYYRLEGGVSGSGLIGLSYNSSTWDSVGAIGHATSGSGAAGTIDGGTQTMAAADNWGVIGFALKPVPSGPATLFGIVARAVTFGEVTAAQRRTTTSLAMPVAFGAVVAGNVSVPAVTHYGALAAPFAFTAVTAARRRTTSSTANPYTFAASSAGQRKTFGVTATPLTFTKAVAATKKTFGATATPLTFGAVTAGRSGIRGTANLHVIAVAVTHYGAVSAPFTFAAATQARRRTTSSIAAPFVFAAVHAGQRKTFSTLAAPFTFGEVTQGRRRTTSSLAAPFTFTKDVRAQRRTTGALTAPFVFGAVAASRKQYARLTAPFVFGEVTAGRKHTRGVIAMPITFGAVTAGIGFTGAATYFGATATTITFSKAVQGQKKTFGVVARPITWAAVVQGRRTTRTQIAAVYTFAALTQAKRKTHAQIVMPIQWLAVTKGISTVGIQTYYGVIARPILFSSTIQTRRRTFATTRTPITFNAFTKGMLMASILNYADDIRWGTIQADRVMVGTTEVWTPGEDL